MIRTSQTHPLQIAEISVQPGWGLIGITLCPGKHDKHGLSGKWQRDLGLDLDVVANWGAAAVVTLVEPDELRWLKVASIGEEVRRRHMEWIHLPIVDGMAPSIEFDTEWMSAGESIRARIQNGFNVLLHCKGGLGRAGTIAAALLIELGVDHEDAIRRVRTSRPGAVETIDQEEYLQHVQPASQRLPGTDAQAIEDRAIGSLLGLAIGDAVGTTLEFEARDSVDLLTDMIGGGPFDLRPGQWTDDTSMALALADSLLLDPKLDAIDLQERFVSWWRDGLYSCTGDCFDIGITTETALENFELKGSAVSGSTDPSSAGNGSLMRLAPVAISSWHDQERRRDTASRQSRTTHAAPEAVDACVSFADILAQAIAGQVAPWNLRSDAPVASPSVSAIIDGSWCGKLRSSVKSSGYVLHTLEAALWCVGRTSSFRDAVLLAANLADDADTTAAVTGQLAGAIYGKAGIPAEWLERLAWSDKIEEMARRLFRATDVATQSNSLVDEGAQAR
jgi:ADP-ribosyl-[dinitrogen reductase] hydrolase